LHELLLALNGHHGQIFAMQNDKIKVTPLLPLLHPCETQIINGLLELATEYDKLQRFMARHRDHERHRGSAGLQDRRLLEMKVSVHASRGAAEDHHLVGLYVEALCHGLDAVLEPYRRAIVDLEKAVLEDGDLQLTHIQHILLPFQPVLEALNRLIKQLYLRRAHGCYILDIVYKASMSGVARVQEAMNKLLHEGHKVLYKQLLAWILQGSLFDPYDEFFIVPDESSANPSDQPPMATSSFSSSSAQSSQLLSAEDSTNFHTRAKKYRLRAERVPGHISVSLAEKIFFIGESIQLFESDKRIEVHGEVLRERETDLYQQLTELRDKQEFRISEFERFVDGIRETASKHLHTLVLERADLKEELATARNFFLLGRGELFHSFISQADAYLQRPPTATTQHDVSQAFLASCRVILHEDEEAVSKKVKVEVASPNAVAQMQIASLRAIVGWDCLSLRYAVPWPLHLVLTEKNLESYNRVFRFLLSVRRTQLALHKTWAKQVSEERESFSNYNFVCQLRNHMTFVVDNLQQYFMADVLESQFSILIRSVDQSTNFEDLSIAHDSFLAAVLTHTFVNNKAVLQCLNELLQSCLDYRAFVDANPASELTESSSALTSVETAFARQSGLLFQLLSSLRNHQAGSHLAKLLLRIDFNRYFSRHGHNVRKIA